MENFEVDPQSPKLQLKSPSITETLPKDENDQERPSGNEDSSSLSSSEISVSHENSNGLKLPPENVSISWCKEKTSQLENQRVLALSRKIHDDELLEKNIKHCDHSLIKARRNEYSPPVPTLKNCSRYEFAGDVIYFGVNKHPSIHDMIDISEEVFVPYDQVFHRFSELRIINQERCEKNDTCERVSKYFISKIGYNGLLTENTVAMMHHEFKNFIHLGPMTDTGRIHLIVDKLDLPPDTVRKFYYKWFIKSRQLESTLETVVFEEQKLYQREIERHHAHMQNTPGDHEYSKRMARRDLKTESLLRIIHKRPEITVSEAIIVSSIYKVDIKKIHLLVKKNLESMRIIQECFEDNCDSEFVNFTPSNVSNWKDGNDPSTFDSALEDAREKKERKRNIRNDIEMGEEQKNIDLIPDVNPPDSLALTAEILNISNILSGPDCSKNRFAGDFQLFELNRHPSIGEMLAISKMTGAKYKQVFYRFRDFRNALKEPCSRNDNCRKVLKFFAHRTEYDGILHGKSVNKMYNLFKKFGADGKSPDIGYIHLVAEQVDLPAFVVREQYKDWFMSMKKEEDESSDTSEINRKKELYERLENEYNASSETSYERLVHMAKKYDTTQKNILNFFDSKIENIEELLESAIPEASSEPREAPNGSTDQNSTNSNEILNQLNEKFLKNDFNSKLNNYELYQQKPSKQVSNNSHSANNALGTDYYEANESLYEMFQSEPRVSGSVKRNIKSTNSSYSKRIKLGSIDLRHSENQREQGETEDVEIDVVGLDDDSGESEAEGIHTTDDYQSIYQFPEDFEIFQANRHPTILEMINISYDTGVSYEQVFFRFKHFRKLNNEECSPGDPCEKVEKFSEANPDLGGVLNKRTLGIIYEEFEHLIHLGYYLPLGYIHMIMEKVDLPASVIRLQYGEWYRKRRGYPKGVLPDMSNSTMLIGHAPKEEDRLYLTNDELVQSEGENNTGKE